MVINREQIVGKLHDKTGYFKRDIRLLLSAYDEVVKECFTEVNDDEEVLVQLAEGIKCGCKIQPERDRVNPKNGNPIRVKATCKPFAKFSANFRDTIQKNYESTKSEET